MARSKIEPYFACRATKLIYNEITLYCQLRANEIKSLKGLPLNRFQVHESLLPLVEDNQFHNPPDPVDSDLEMGSPTTPKPPLREPVLFAGEDLTQQPDDANSLRRRIAYSEAIVPAGDPEEDIDLYASD